MHEIERHSAILQAIKERPVVTIDELVSLTEASEATVRRDITALHAQNRLRRVRGGAESINQPHLAGAPFAVNATKNSAAKRAIAQAAIDLCKDGEPIIINGGTIYHYFIGRNPTASTFSGVNVKRIKFILFCCMGVRSGWPACC